MKTTKKAGDSAEAIVSRALGDLMIRDCIQIIDDALERTERNGTDARDILRHALKQVRALLKL
jgi:hypothetical protein